MVSSSMFLRRSVIGQGEWVVSMNEVTCMEENSLTPSGTNEGKQDAYLDILTRTLHSRR